MQETRLDLGRIRAARGVIDAIFLDTPLYRCESMESELGCAVSIKLETANPVRSFKARGAEVVASLLSDTGSTALVCASAGNLGQALAWSGRARGIDVTVVASRFTPAVKLDRIRALDARLELVEVDFDMARERAVAIARYDGIRLVEDSLDIETCEGAATIGLELVEAVPSFDAVLIALGGRALATGVGHVVKAWEPEFEVICVQPLGAPAMTYSWRQRRVVTTDSTNTIADGVAGQCPIPAVLDDLLLVADDAVLVQEASPHPVRPMTARNAPPNKRSPRRSSSGRNSDGQTDTGAARGARHRVRQCGGPQPSRCGVVPTASRLHDHHEFPGAGGFDRRPGARRDR